MALITCPECKKKISEKADSCPKCGYKFTPGEIAEIKKKGKLNQGCGCGCLLVIIIAIIVIIGSSDSANRTTSKGSSPTSNSKGATTSPQKSVAATPIPSDVTYMIISEDIVPGIKRGLDIQLNKKVTKNVLRAIAMKLKNSDPKTYKRTFIGYYLPGMEINAGYWATTHFDPDLKVQILGLTAEEEQALSQKPKYPSGDVIGRWLDESPFNGGRIIIFRKDGKLFMEKTYKDGTSGTKELIEKDSSMGRRFEKDGGSTAGDHWILDANGNLQLRDNEGLISTAKKIQ